MVFSREIGEELVLRSRALAEDGDYWGNRLDLDEDRFRKVEKDCTALSALVGQLLREIPSELLEWALVRSNGVRLDAVEPRADEVSERVSESIGEFPTVRVLIRLRELLRGRRSRALEAVNGLIIKDASKDQFGRAGVHPMIGAVRVLLEDPESLLLYRLFDRSMRVRFGSYRYDQEGKERGDYQSKSVFEAAFRSVIPEDAVLLTAAGPLDGRLFLGFYATRWRRRGVVGLRETHYARAAQFHCIGIRPSCCSVFVHPDDEGTRTVAESLVRRGYGIGADRLQPLEVSLPIQRIEGMIRGATERGQASVEGILRVSRVDLTLADRSVASVIRFRNRSHGNSSPVLSEGLLSIVADGRVARLELRSEEQGSHVFLDRLEDMRNDGGGEEQYCLSMSPWNKLPVRQVLAAFGGL